MFSGIIIPGFDSRPLKPIDSKFTLMVNIISLKESLGMVMEVDTTFLSLAL